MNKFGKNCQRVAVDDMKSLFGSKKKSTSSGGGQKLGGGAAASDNGLLPGDRFEVRFAKEGSLGMDISCDPADGGAFVASVVPKSEAEKNGVRAGFRVVALEGNELASFSDFMSVMQVGS